jgi:uncharacterized membrane protein
VAERIGTILLSAVLAHSGWHWMSERSSQLGEYSFQLPAFSLALLASFMRWLMLLVVIGAVLWAMVQVYDRFLRAGDPAKLSQSTDSG